jgi:D-beta-D-heptose 7-phosphate kinase/D-beta-D-heptose 1-phosphate adenosyltransferase
MSPEAPVPVFKVLKTEKSGGMAFNVKTNLEGLNVSVGLLTNDKTIIKSRYIDTKSRQHLLRVDSGEEQLLKVLSEEALNSIDFALYNAIVISDYDKGLLDAHIIKRILSKAGDLPVFVDSKKKDLSCYENCILKINNKEYQEASFFPLNCELIVTLGEEGVLYKEERFPTKKVEIFDVCGAGDTFLAALAYAYLMTGDMERSIKFANECGGVVVQKFGTYAIKLEDLDGICI